MPDRFATAVWVNPAAMRQCRTVFAKRDTPLLLLFLEVWRGFSAISQSAYPSHFPVQHSKVQARKRPRAAKAGPSRSEGLCAPRGVPMQQSALA
jgi:hypothetical protein